jgi:hypothetical protein
MKSSLNSNVLAAVGLSQPTDLSVRFVYSYYVPEEAATEDTTPYADSKEGRPRSVILNFTAPSLAENEVLGDFSDYAILVNDVDRVHSVEDVPNMPNTYITLQDTGLLSRATDAISRSCSLRGIEGNPTDKALSLSNQLSGSIDQNTMQKLAVNFSSLNTSFYTENAIIDSEKYAEASGFPVTVLTYDKISAEILAKSEIASPDRSPVQAGLTSKYLLDRQDAARNALPTISGEEFTSILSPISFFERKTSRGYTPIDRRMRRAGYLIERVEERSSGERSKFLVGVIDSQTNSFIDYNVRYGSRYSYTVRAAYSVQVPEVLLKRNDSIASRVLFASSPSNIATVTTEEYVPPPPPGDIRFNFDHTKSELAVRWEFPVNRSRDVTRFQLFRRRSLSEPFTLLKEFDFDQSVIEFKRIEAPLPVNVVKSKQPIRRALDYDFGRSSDYIYAVCCVDAHGYVSNYSAQYRVSFNRRLNNIVVKCVSPPNAPRPYPNLYVNLPGTLTLDSITRTGLTSMNVVFDPEYLKVTDRLGNDLEFVKYDSEGAKYYVNVIDTTRAEQVTVPIAIEDLRSR